MAWTANYTAPGAQFILIRIGHFTSPIISPCQKKNGSIPAWCHAATTKEIDLALEYVENGLIAPSPGGAGLNGSNVTVLLSLASKDRYTTCPTSDPDLNGLYATYLNLNIKMVAIHAAAGNFEDNVDGVSQQACDPNVFANGGYWDSNKHRDWRSGSGANVYALSRHNDWDFHNELWHTYNNLAGTSNANAAAAGYWARLRSDPRYVPGFIARTQEGVHLRGIFEEDAMEDTAGISQSAMSTTAGYYARYWDEDMDDNLVAANNNADDITTGDGRAQSHSGYSFGNWAFLLGCSPISLTEWYYYNYGPPSGVHIQFANTIIQVHASFLQGSWIFQEDGWWDTLPTLAYATGVPENWRLRFRRIFAWGLTGAAKHFVDVSPWQRRITAATGHGNGRAKP